MLDRVKQPSAAESIADGKNVSRPHTQKPRVLFVDDELDVLHSLRRMFGNHCERWNLHFVNSGPEAIEYLQQEYCDVIVTDMRMPGLDGTAVLRFAAERSPGSVRYVLSGQTDQDSIDNAAHLIHQYLHKPASLNELEQAIETGLHNGCDASSEKVREFVNGLSSLPSQPKIYADLVKCSQSEACTIHDITDIVQRDPAVSAKVLQLVNSSFYGLATRVSSIPLAIRYLGVENLKRLALAASIFRTAKFQTSQSNHFVEKVWGHSFECAEKAAEFAAGVRLVNSSEAFTAGLLHDAGKLLLLEAAENDYLEIANSRTLSQAEQLAAEQQAFGFTHAQLGAHMLQVWGLPSEIVDSVFLHHDELPEKVDKYTVSHVVNAANQQLAVQSGRLAFLTPLLVEIQSDILANR